MTDPAAYYTQVVQAAEAIRGRAGRVPQVAVILGSGLGEFAGKAVHATSIAYTDLPHWPASRVPGHEGRLVVGDIGRCRVALLSGRCHTYEGHDLATVTFAVRVLGLVGVKTLILTNAAGGINTGFAQGALMVIDDHINLLGANPLVGVNDERFGPRFLDLSTAYSPRLRGLADEAGRQAGVDLVHGVYAALSGPSYETPAEIRYLRTIGADAVGMSTVPEAIVGRHMGIEVLGISCITNMAAGVLPQPIDHAEVLATTHRVRDSFMALLEGVIGRL